MESHCKSSWPIRLSIRRMFLGSKALRHPSYRAQRGRDIIWNCSGLSHWDGKGELCNYSISLSGLICLAFKLGFFSFFGLVASFLALCWQDSPLCGIRVSHTHTHTHKPHQHEKHQQQEQEEPTTTPTTGRRRRRRTTRKTRTTATTIKEAIEIWKRSLRQLPLTRPLGFVLAFWAHICFYGFLWPCTVAALRTRALWLIASLVPIKCLHWVAYNGHATSSFWISSGPGSWGLSFTSIGTPV